MVIDCFFQYASSILFCLIILLRIEKCYRRFCYAHFTRFSYAFNQYSTCESSYRHVQVNYTYVYCFRYISIVLVYYFSKSFQDVVEVQSDIWNYQQYAVVREYYDRPPFIIPFSTFFDIIALTKMFYLWYLRVRYNYASPTHRVFSELNRSEKLFFNINAT